MSQSLASVLVHLVFSTKNREPLLTPDVEPELYPYMATVFREYGCPSLTGNGTADHTHWLFALSRTVTIADVVEEVKKSSSKWLKSKSPALAAFQWQAGYGAFSIGASNVAALTAYIANQKEHHRRRSFQDEFRTLLNRYGVAYDERYVWD
jgi:REP element-mobilizing transposase RayT